MIGLDLPADAGGHHRREQPEKAMGFGGCAHRDAGPVPGRLAAGAGVSRATLYRHFASVTDLLDGVAADLLARARFDRLLAALELGDPAEALREVTVAGTGIWAIDTTLVRNLFSLARASPRRSRSSPSSRPGAWAPWSTWPPACSRPAGCATAWTATAPPTSCWSSPPSPPGTSSSPPATAPRSPGA